MKKKILPALFAVLLLLILCACGNDEPLGLVISLDGDGEWLLETQKQGVVDLVTEPEKDAGTGETVFVFEAVGEGETELDFYLVKANYEDISQAMREVKYRVTVHSDYTIESELISDEEITKPAVKLNNKEDAEAYFSENIKDTFESEEEYVVKYIETYSENGLKWYKFSLSHIITLDSGETVLRFKQMYAVSENGEIKLLDGDYNIPDEPLELK